jgi:putative transcriptional regulator
MMGKRLRRNSLATAAVTAMLAAVWLTGVVPARADEDLAEGTLLVADRKLNDPHFAQTVVLIVTYDDHGAVGLVLNRPSDVSVSALLAGVKDAKNRKDTAFTGGPVEPMSVLALLRTRDGPRGAQHVAGDIWAILDQDLLEEALSAHAGSDELRFYVGYAGWKPGQLEAELEAGAWRVIRGSADTVFDAKPDSLWDRVVRGLDLTLAKLTR